MSPLSTEMYRETKIILKVLRDFLSFPGNFLKFICKSGVFGYKYAVSRPLGKGNVTSFSPNPC